MKSIYIINHDNINIFLGIWFHRKFVKISWKLSVSFHALHSCCYSFHEIFALRRWEQISGISSVLCNKNSVKSTYSLLYYIGKLFSRNIFQMYDSYSAVWKNTKFTLNEKKFRQINSFTFFSKSVVFTHFCTNSVRAVEINFVKFHSVTHSHVMSVWKHKEITST